MLKPCYSIANGSRGIYRDGSARMAIASRAKLAERLARLHRAGFKRLTGIDRRSDYFGASDVATFVQGDVAQSERVELGPFDLITAIEVFEHMANPEAIFAFASQHLEAGGWLIVTTPNIYSVRVRMRFLLSANLTLFPHNA